MPYVRVIFGADMVYGLLKGDRVRSSKVIVKLFYVLA